MMIQFVRMRLGGVCMVKAAIWSLLHQAIGENRNKEMLSLMAVEDPEIFLRATLKELQHLVPDIKDKQWEKFLSLRQKFDLNRRMFWLEKHDVRVIGLTEPAYPPLLSNIYDPPAILYVRGCIDYKKLHLAVVGSRKATHYGLEVAKMLGHGLSSEDVVVVSGLARGIDGSSHLGALDGGGGTIAVLGTGIDKIYPKEHKALYEHIIYHPNGAVMTPFPLGASPLPFHFPRRNRVIAGLSSGLIVVEAAAKSGALITAHLALDNGRDVFAVPGMITSELSVGCLRLIKDGAKMVIDVNDILEEYGQLSLFSESKEINLKDFTLDEQEIMNILSDMPLSIEEIVLRSTLSVNDVMSTLSMLEISGAVDQLVGRRYVRKVYR